MTDPEVRQSEARWRLAAARDAAAHASERAAETFLKACGVVFALALVFAGLLLVSLLSGCDGPSSYLQDCAKSCRESGRPMASFIGGTWNSGTCTCGDAAPDGGK